MGAIQSSINQMLGTAAAASLAIEKSDMMADAKNTALSHLEGVEASEAEALAQAQTKIDEATLQSKLANTEAVNPSASNKDNLMTRISSAVDAEKAVSAAKKAKANLETHQRLMRDIRPGAADLNKGGWLQKFITSRKIINTNPVTEVKK